MLVRGLDDIEKRASQTMVYPYMYPMYQHAPRIPGLVNIQKAMENHHFLMGKSTINDHFQLLC